MIHFLCLFSLLSLCGLSIKIIGSEFGLHTLISLEFRTDPFTGSDLSLDTSFFLRIGEVRFFTELNSGLGLCSNLGLASVPGLGSSLELDSSVSCIGVRIGRPSGIPYSAIVFLAWLGTESRGFSCLIVAHFLRWFSSDWSSKGRSRQQVELHKCHFCIPASLNKNFVYLVTKIYLNKDESSIGAV